MSRHTAEKRSAFRALHKDGCFVLPNPWDVGSACYLASAGFKAIATTSSGFAWSTGRPDNGVSRDAILAHLREMVGATNLPVNADFENGFGDDPTEVAHSVRMAVDTGIAGLSIEDSTGDPKSPLFPLDVAVERLAAARRAIDETGGDTLLVGRAENFFVGVPDLEDVVARLRAYAQAGADCLYAPGIQTREQIEAVLARGQPEARQSVDRRTFRVYAQRTGEARRAVRERGRRTRTCGVERARDWRSVACERPLRSLADGAVKRVVERHVSGCGVASSSTTDRFYMERTMSREIIRVEPLSSWLERWKCIGTAESTGVARTLRHRDRLRRGDRQRRTQCPDDDGRRATRCRSLTSNA